MSDERLIRPEPFLSREAAVYLLTTIAAGVLNMIAIITITFFVTPAVNRSADEARAARADVQAAREEVRLAREEARAEVREIRADLKRSHDLIFRASQSLESYAGIMVWWEQWRQAAEAKKAAKEKKK